MRRYLRVTGRVKLWVSGLHPDVSAAIMIRKQSLESSTVSRLAGRFTAEVQHRKQNNGHHFQLHMSSTTNIGWEVEVVTVTVLLQRLTSEKSIFMQF